MLRVVVIMMVGAVLYAAFALLYRDKNCDGNCGACGGSCHAAGGGHDRD